MIVEMTGDETLEELRRHAAHARAERGERDIELMHATRIHRATRGVLKANEEACSKRLEHLHSALSRPVDVEAHMAAESAYAKAYLRAQESKEAERNAESALVDARQQSRAAAKRYEDVMAVYLNRIEEHARERVDAPEPPGFDPQSDADTGE